MWRFRCSMEEMLQRLIRAPAFATFSIIEKSFAGRPCGPCVVRAHEMFGPRVSRTIFVGHQSTASVLYPLHHELTRPLRLSAKQQIVSRDLELTSSSWQHCCFWSVFEFPNNRSTLCWKVYTRAPLPKTRVGFLSTNATTNARWD